MLVKDLIQSLQIFEPEMTVAISDWKQNLAEDWGEGTSAGNYGKFDIVLMGKDSIPEGNKPWVALQFSNDFLNDDGQRDDNKSSWVSIFEMPPHPMQCTAKIVFPKTKEVIYAVVNWDGEDWIKPDWCEKGKITHYIPIPIEKHHYELPKTE